MQALTQRVTALESALAAVAQTLSGLSSGAPATGTSGASGRKGTGNVVDVTGSRPADVP